MTDKQIAQELGISQETVGTYWRRILLRFGACSRTEVVAKLAESEARDRIQAAEAQTEALQDEVSRHVSAHEREAARRTLLEALKEASLDFIGGTASFGATFNHILASVTSLTESNYGFIAEVRYDPDSAPYLETRALSTIEGAPAHTEFRNLNTLYGRVVKTEAAVISNDTLNDRYAAGLPDGHPPIQCFLGLPILDGARLVGVIGLANRPGGYDFDLIDFVEPLTATCGRLISAYRADVAWKDAEREIVSSAHRLSILMDNLSSGVLFGDCEGKVQFVNKAFCQLFGLDCSPIELVGSECATNAAAMSAIFVDSKSFAPRVEELIAGGQAVAGELLELRDGRVFARDFVPINLAGSPEGYLWHFRDVTSRVQESKTLSAILDAVSDAVIVLNDLGEVRFWNKRAAAMFGFTAEEVVGRDLADLIIPEKFVKAYGVALRALMRSGDSVDSLAVEAQTKDRAEVHVDLSVTPIVLNSTRLFAAFLRPKAGR